VKVSVLMLAYNHERYIAQAIQSALDQETDFDFEIVIGEDCSTDCTREIVEDFHRRYPGRIVFSPRTKNVGMMQNYLQTLSSCSGQYVAHLEGDDYWTRKDKLQMQVNFLDTHPDFAICCARATVIDELGLGGPDIIPTHSAGTYSIDDLVLKNMICTLTVMYRPLKKGSVPLWLDGLGMGDWPMHILVAQHGSIKLMDEVCGAYRMHGGGVWSAKSQVRRFREVIRILVTLNEGLAYRYNGVIRQAMAEYYLQWNSSIWESESRLEACRCLHGAILNGAYKIDAVRPILRSLAYYALLGPWLPKISRAKRRVLGPQ
jgi:glycosyltransferase involved in cell wall biosynthesis